MSYEEDKFCEACAKPLETRMLRIEYSRETGEPSGYNYERACPIWNAWYAPFVSVIHHYRRTWRQSKIV